MNDEFYFDGDHNGGIYNSKNLNVYGYCYQNPILFYDPNGKQSKFWTRTIGAVQMIGGVVEAVVGGVGGVVTAETGVGAVVGYAVLAIGCDNTVAGFNQMITGESQSTLLHKGVKATASVAGANENTAENIATGADIATIALGGINSVNTIKTASKVVQETNNVSKIINIGKQGKHIVGHNNYQTGKSILTENAQTLLDNFHAGKVKSTQIIDEVKTRVNFGKPIGEYVKDGISYPTTNGIIHNSKNGVHIVPSAPN